MRKSWRIGLAALLAVLLLAGCGPKKPLPDEGPPQPIKLYFANDGNERLVVEERRIKIHPQADKYQVVLAELIKGSQDKSLRANIDPNTRVYGTIKQNEFLIVDVSSEFNRFGGSLAEIMAVGSVVNTLTQFAAIKKVKILVEGEELIGPSGQPRGFMAPFPLDPGQEETRIVTLYFGNKDATAVAGEKRSIRVPAGASREEFLRRILMELIKGPTRPDLSRTIPPEVRVLSVQLKDRIAHVDFSQEMHTRHWHGTAGEAMTINSIVNTLTEFDYVERVKMTVAGAPLNIEHAILTDPVARNERMIQK